MERVAVFVDAGYFWFQVAQFLYGDNTPRHEMRIREEINEDIRKILIEEVAKQFPGSSLLRIYWYDGRIDSHMPNSQQKHMACLDDIKMRYGTINSFGQQKEVDGLLIADLLMLAQNRAINSALIISGDADLAPGINAAQALGVRIHRLGIYNDNGTSPAIREVVDKNCILDISFASKYKEGADDLPDTLEWQNEDEDAQSTETDPTHETLEEFMENLTEEEKEAIKLSHRLPAETDKRLLAIARKHFPGSWLEEEEKRELRKLVVNRVTNP